MDIAMAVESGQLVISIQHTSGHRKGMTEYEILEIEKVPMEVTAWINVIERKIDMKAKADGRTER